MEDGMSCSQLISMLGVDFESFAAEMPEQPDLGAALGDDSVRAKVS